MLAAATILAVVVLVRRLESNDLLSRMRGADLRWVAGAVAFSVLPVLGNTVSLIALTPGRLPFWRLGAVQLATSFVNLVTPASAGGLALNVRFLNRRGLTLAAAVAAVSIVQATSVLVTAVLVIMLLLFSGRVEQVGGLLPWQALVAVAVIVVLLLGLLMVWNQGRTWLAGVALRPLREAWPQLLATLASPNRLIAGGVGHLVVTMGFAGTLGAAVRAFGGSVSLVLLTLVVVGSLAVSGAVPVPGGIGAAEAALVAGLVTAKVDASAALSAALLFRLVTFWARVPVGWVALLALRRSGDV